MKPVILKKLSLSVLSLLTLVPFMAANADGPDPQDVQRVSATIVNKTNINFTRIGTVQDSSCYGKLPSSKIYESSTSSFLLDWNLCKDSRARLSSPLPPGSPTVLYQGTFHGESVSCTISYTTYDESGPCPTQFIQSGIKCRLSQPAQYDSAQKQCNLQIEIVK